MAIINTPMASLKAFIGSFFPSLVIEKEHQHLLYPLSEKLETLLRETGYLHLQATKPDTLGSAFNCISYEAVFFMIFSKGSYTFFLLLYLFYDLFVYFL